MALSLTHQPDRSLHRLVKLLPVHDLEVVGIPLQVPEQGLDSVLVPHQNASGQPLLLCHGRGFKGDFVLGRRDHHDPRG